MSPPLGYHMRVNGTLAHFGSIKYKVRVLRFPIERKCVFRVNAPSAASHSPSFVFNRAVLTIAYNYSIQNNGL